MTRFHISSPSCSPWRVESSGTSTYNLLLKRKLPKEREQHALRDAATYMSVRVRDGRYVWAHLPVRKSTSLSGAGVVDGVEGTICALCRTHRASPYRYLQACVGARLTLSTRPRVK